MTYKSESKQQLAVGRKDPYKYYCLAPQMSSLYFYVDPLLFCPLKGTPFMSKNVYTFNVVHFKYYLLLMIVAFLLASILWELPCSEYFTEGALFYLKGPFVLFRIAVYYF